MNLLCLTLSKGCKDQIKYISLLASHKHICYSHWIDLEVKNEEAKALF